LTFLIILTTSQERGKNIKKEELGPS